MDRNDKCGPMPPELFSNSQRQWYVNREAKWSAVKWADADGAEHGGLDIADNPRGRPTRKMHSIHQPCTQRWLQIGPNRRIASVNTSMLSWYAGLISTLSWLQQIDVLEWDWHVFTSFHVTLSWVICLALVGLCRERASEAAWVMFVSTLCHS